METLQELADTLAAFDEAAALKLARDEANPFAKVRAHSGQYDAKALAAAVATAYRSDDVWAALRFHRKMTGIDLMTWFDGLTFALWMDTERLTLSGLDDLKVRAWEWLQKPPA